MSAMLLCPDRTILKDLVKGSLPSAQCDELTAHLDTCFDCQETLEMMESGESSLPKLTGQQASTDWTCEPALQRAIDKLESLSGVPGAASAGAEGTDEPPTFLEPPRDPAYLGALGRYDILEVVRRGGMGWVLRAKDPHLNRTVAIKVIAPHLITSSSARRRFAREALAAGTIHDRHVVAIHSVEETGQGIPYLVMEYIEGTSLQDRLEVGRLEVREIVAIATQVTRGLAAAHEHGVIHRDIKPGNIMLEADTNRALLTDFGLARAVDDVSLTQSGVAAGTPQYMAPEQARGESADQRGDLFSLGSVLYAMCTGHPPFRANGNLAVLNQICEATPHPIREINPAIPEWLVGVIAKLHAKRPEDRFASATEVATALDRQVLLPAPRRHFPKWAAVVFLALVGLTVTEATQITNLAGVVIRIFTPDGTLIVEVDDPAVKVMVENNGKEVVVTGPGIQELRLRIGEHKIQATRDGKPMVLTEDVVTITRDEKRVLRVSRDADGATQAGQRLRESLSDFDLGMRTVAKDMAMAERLFRQAVGNADKLVAEFPKDLLYQQHAKKCRWGLATAFNMQSDQLVKNPQITDANVQRALALSGEAVKLAPHDYGFWLNLGLAQYRAKDWKAALINAEKAMNLRNGGASDEWFVLAMIHWQLGEKDKAREYYDRAVVLMNKKAPNYGPWRVQRAEVEQLLGISKSDK